MDGIRFKKITADQRIRFETVSIVFDIPEII